MTFIEGAENPTMLVELKYCERCGGLWLRPQATNGVYCATCRACLAAMPDPGTAPVRKARRRRKAKNQSGGVKAANIECLQGVAAAEVWA
ncbi:MAG: hypothetical protein WBX02_20080 [Terriglobales bacterium]